MLIIQAAIQAETCNKKFSLDSDDITYQLKDWEGASYVSLDELEFGFSLLEGVSTKVRTLQRCPFVRQLVIITDSNAAWQQMLGSRRIRCQRNVQHP